MDFGSQVVQPEALSGQPFDIQGFKDLLTTLRQSKEQQKDKAKPLYNPEE